MSDERQLQERLLQLQQEDIKQSIESLKQIEKFIEKTEEHNQWLHALIEGALQDNKRRKQSKTINICQDVAIWKGKLSNYGSASMQQSVSTVEFHNPACLAPESHNPNDTIDDALRLGILLLEKVAHLPRKGAFNEENTGSMQQIVSTVEFHNSTYLAPESHNLNAHCLAIDVYIFGILLPKKVVHENENQCSGTCLV